MTTPIKIDTRGLDPIRLPEDAPDYRVAQLRLKRDAYIRRMPTARSKDMKYLLFRVIVLNDLIELGVADIHEVIRKWRRVYYRHSLSEVQTEWFLLESYAEDGAEHLSEYGKSLDQIYPEGKEPMDDDDGEDNIE